MTKPIAGGVYFVSHPEIIYEEVSTKNAYQFFKKKEAEIHEFEPKNLVKKQFKSENLEIPSAKLIRLQDELAELEEELKELEKEDFITSLDETTDSQK